MLQQFKNHIWLHIIVFLFGFTGILGKLITLEALTLVWYRVFIAFTAIGLYLVIKRQRLLTDKKGLLKMLATGAITATHWFCFFESIKQSNVSISLICLSTTTFFTAFIEPLFHKRKVRLYEVTFGLIVIIGMAFIFQIEDEYRLGIIYGLLSAFLAAIFSVINSLLIREYYAKLISMWELIGGFLAITIFMLLGSGIPEIWMSSSDLFYMLILGILCTAFAYVVSVEVMKELTPFTVNITINLEHVYGIILALLVFGESERMSFEFYIGAVIILLVIFTNALVKRQLRITASKGLSKP